MLSGYSSYAQLTRNDAELAADLSTGFSSTLFPQLAAVLVGADIFLMAWPQCSAL